MAGKKSTGSGTTRRGFVAAIGAATAAAALPAAGAPGRSLLEAVEELRAAYVAHVERLAEELKPRLLAGEFNGYTDDEGGPDAKLRWDALEALAASAPRPWGEDGALTVALASAATRAKATDVVDWLDPEDRAAFQMAWDVRELAAARWGAPLDDIWGDPS